MVEGDMPRVRILLRGDGMNSVMRHAELVKIRDGWKKNEPTSCCMSRTDREFMTQHRTILTEMETVIHTLELHGAAIQEAQPIVESKV
jgi:hypothetical protein